MDKKKILGWGSFTAGCLWLLADYQAVRNPQRIWYAIFWGWTTLGLALAHIFV